MTRRVGRKGQVVIRIRVERAVSADALMGRLAGYRLVAALERDRRAERRR